MVPALPGSCLPGAEWSRGIPFDCFEKGSRIGGNWRYENDNGMSSAYRSLHINTSRQVMAFKTLPMPDHYPDYPNHFQMAAYFDEYVDHFGLRGEDPLPHRGPRVEPVEGEWEVTVEDADGERETQRYRAVLVANGHHWDPRWPEPAFPAPTSSAASRSTSTTTASPTSCPASGCWCSGSATRRSTSPSSPRGSPTPTFLAMRRGAYVLPKYINGKPIDETATPLTSTLPIPVQRFFLNARARSVAAGEMTAYGLPKPDHKLFEAHPTVSSELLPRLGHGDISVKPNIDRFTGGRTVRFADGSEEEIDLVVYCTGYKITFPFLDPRRLLRARQPHAALPAGRRPSTTRASSSSASSSRSARSCRWPRRRRNGSPTCSAAGRRYRRRRRCRTRSRRRTEACEALRRL